MEFPFGQTVIRERRRPVPNPYDPEQSTPGRWEDDLDAIALEGAFVASSSSSGLTDATRTQVSTSKSLYISDPAVDVLVGDRIKVGQSTLYINAKPEADINPFTGWQPVAEIPLEETAG